MYTCISHVSIFYVFRVQDYIYSLYYSIIVLYSSLYTSIFQPVYRGPVVCIVRILGVPEEKKISQVVLWY